MFSCRLILALVVVQLLALSVLMHEAELVIDIDTPGTAIYGAIFTVLAAAVWWCRRARAQAGTEAETRANRVLGDLAEYVGLFMMISLLGAFASYPVAGLSHGFADAMLERCDLALGFDWLAWYRTVAAYPLLQIASRSAYAMIYVSPGILLGWLAWTGQRREAHAFLAAVWLAAMITLVAFRFMPAVGPFAYLWHAPVPYLPVSDLWQPQLIPKLRIHAIHGIDPGHLVGLVSAPSFHAAAAVLLIAFARRQQVIGRPLIAVNLAMLLATPVEGTHYLTDMILGALVALLSLHIVALLGGAAFAAPASWARAGLRRALAGRSPVP